MRSSRCRPICAPSLCAFSGHHDEAYPTALASHAQAPSVPCGSCLLSSSLRGLQSAICWPLEADRDSRQFLTSHCRFSALSTRCSAPPFVVAFCRSLTTRDFPLPFAFLSALIARHSALAVSHKRVRLSLDRLEHLCYSELHMRSVLCVVIAPGGSHRPPCVEIGWLPSCARRGQTLRADSHPCRGATTRRKDFRLTTIRHPVGDNRGRETLRVPTARTVTAFGSQDDPCMGRPGAGGSAGEAGWQLAARSCPYCAAVCADDPRLLVGASAWMNPLARLAGESGRPRPATRLCPPPARGSHTGQLNITATSVFCLLPAHIW